MISKRRFFLCACGAACLAGNAMPVHAALPPIPMDKHEAYMRLAIAEARGNPRYPFGAVIVRPETGEVMARGVNDSSTNPILHGEIACLNDYVRRHGNKDWAPMVLYTTAEPCSMCMSALVWAGIGGVVFASSIEGLRDADIDQIQIRAQSVVDASPFYRGLLLGGVLATETDKMFMGRQR